MGKTIGCIIARTNSRRLAKKVLIKIDNKRLIEHIINRLKKAKNLDLIYMCTSIDPEDRILLEIAKENGIKAYAGSRKKVIDRMLNVAEMENADYVFRITGDNIFTDEIFLDKSIELIKKYKGDYCRVSNLPRGVTSEGFSVSKLRAIYNSIDPDQTEYLTYFIFFTENNLKKLILIPPKKFQKPFFSLTVDTPEDLERTRHIFKKLGDKKWIYYDDILDLHENEQIPYLVVNKNQEMKFPNNQLKLYKDYLEELDEMYKKCINIKLEEDFYEKYKYS